MAGYTKEFLVSAFLERFINLPTKDYEAAEKQANEFYDKAGRDKFRVYCSLDAAALRRYKEAL